MSSQKRRRVVGAGGVQASLQSLAQLCAGESDEDDEARAMRQMLCRAVVEPVVTPYGDVVQHVDVPLTGGGFYRLEFLHPMCLLYHLCLLSPEYSSMVRAFSSTVCDTVWWTDETSTGNILSPSSHAKYCSIYWTCLEWPYHVRRRGQHLQREFKRHFSSSKTKHQKQAPKFVTLTQTANLLPSFKAKTLTGPYQKTAPLSVLVLLGGWAPFPAEG